MMHALSVIALIVLQLILCSLVGYVAYWYGAAEASLECIDRAPGVRLWRA